MERLKGLRKRAEDRIDRGFYISPGISPAVAFLTFPHKPLILSKI